MSIVFPQELTVGVPEIDEYHRSLYLHANRLRDAMRSGDREEASAILAFLGDYARDHFGAEERLMSESGYPGLEAHRECHERFRADFARLVARFGAHGATARNVVELSSWLADWLVEHIRGEDLAMARWLTRASQPSG